MALRATVENCDQIARLMACDFAEAVLRFTKNSIRTTIAARLY